MGRADVHMHHGWLLRELDYYIIYHWIIIGGGEGKEIGEEDEAEKGEDSSISIAPLYTTRSSQYNPLQSFGTIHKPSFFFLF